MNDPYTILGVPRTANAAEVKRAYRKRAKKAHPDRVGGSKEAMQEINKAYALLEDPKKRAAYDAGEDPDRPAQSIPEQAKGLLVSAMESVYAQVKESDNMADALRRTLAAAILGQTQELAKAERAAKKAERVLAKLRNGELFREMLEQKANEAKRLVTQIEHGLKVLDEAVRLAEPIGWSDPEAAKQQGWTRYGT